MSRQPQIGFPASRKHQQKLDALARYLGKSQADVLRQCIDDLWASLPEESREKFLATGTKR